MSLSTDGINRSAASHSGVLLGDENEETAAKHTQRGEHHKQDVEEKRPDTQEHILSCCVCITF